MSTIVVFLSGTDEPKLVFDPNGRQSPEAFLSIQANLDRVAGYIGDIEVVEARDAAGAADRNTSAMRANAGDGLFVRTGGQKLYVRRAGRDNGQWDDRPSKVTIELTPLAR